MLAFRPCLHESNPPALELGLQAAAAELASLLLGSWHAQLWTVLSRVWVDTAAAHVFGAVLAAAAAGAAVAAVAAGGCQWLLVPTATVAQGKKSLLGPGSSCDETAVEK